MSATPTARMAIGNLRAETGLAFQMVYRKGADREHRDLIDSLEGRVAIPRVLTDDEGDALAVVPRTWVIDLPVLREEFGRDFRVADDPETGHSFLRGIPIATIASARERGIEVILEQSLVSLPGVYLETLHPHLLLHLDGEYFRRLFYGSWCGYISRASEPARRACGTG